MHRLLIALVAALWGLASLPGATALAQPYNRVALVIGNGAYQTVPKLANPIRDAAAIEAMFKQAGFDWVSLRQDVGNLEFKRALRDFESAATGAEIAVIYYAGHGIQIRDTNFMIPVDARLARETDAGDEAVSIDRILSALEPAKRLRLVILDACRDNPYERTMRRRQTTRAAAKGGGLGAVEPTTSETLIAYAAKAGATAEDGDGANSPFAAALVKHLPVPGLDIRLAFGRVRDDVLKRTGNRQEPFVYGSIGGEPISLVPAPPQPQAAPEADIRRDFEVVKQHNTRRGWEIFIATHKSGLLVEIAKEELKKFDVAAIEPPAPPKPAVATSEERRAWDRVKDAGDLGRIRDFIARYPASPLAETARNRLDALERAAEEREEKARAEREAARQREEQQRQAKAAEAQRQQAAREAAARREAEERAARAAEAERQKAARDAATQREAAERAARAAEAERQKAAREAAARREAEERAQAAEAERQQAARTAERQDPACARDADKLDRLKGFAALGWARADLERLQEETGCARVRQDVVALLAQPPGAVAPGAIVPEPAPAREPAPEAAANTPALIRAAQGELRRLGCYAGREDGSLRGATRDAIARYLAETGRPAGDIKVTEDLVADLKGEDGRVCPLACGRGQHPEGDRCVADTKPEKPAPKAAAREREEPRAKPKPEPRPSREAERRKPATASRPAPQSGRSQAAMPRFGPMIGF
jgi:hypothetical protein